MFKQQEAKGDFKEVETIIGPSVKVKGNFHGEGNIIVEGILEGSLKTKGSVLIGERAKITASINSEDARIGGEVIGNITINGFLEIDPSAKIMGNIECASLFVGKGAIINGKCTMTTGEKVKEEEK